MCLRGGRGRPPGRRRGAGSGPGRRRGRKGRGASPPPVAGVETDSGGGRWRVAYDGERTLAEGLAVTSRTVRPVDAASPPPPLARSLALLSSSLPRIASHSRSQEDGGRGERLTSHVAKDRSIGLGDADGGLADAMFDGFETLSGFLAPAYPRRGAGSSRPKLDQQGRLYVRSFARSLAPE